MKYDELNFSDAEIRLLCGDPSEERVGRAWRDIPIVQAKNNFKNFIQDRGYFAPEFREPKSGLVEFDPGIRSTITRLKGMDFPDGTRLKDNRTVVGEIMTPQRVGSARAWVKKRLQERGYPCPDIGAEAYPATGEIVLTWKNPLPIARITEVREDPKVSLVPHLIRRYDAFRLGQDYSLIRTEITARRSGDAKLTSFHDFDPLCAVSGSDTDAVNGVLLEATDIGPPRLIMFGFGVNTETGPTVQASWAHTRLGRMGSSTEVTFFGSLKDQSVTAKGDWYYHDHPARQHLSPIVSFTHENERRYQAVALRSQALFATSGDITNHSWTFGIGPGWQNVQQITGTGPLNSQYVSAVMQVAVASHLFEYYGRSPRTGYRLALNTTGTPQNIPRVGRALLSRLEGQILISPGSSDPPLWVLGFRGQAFATFLQDPVSVENLPVDFRRWVGGGQDVRGYGRQEIPPDDFGAVTGATLGMELRIPHFLGSPIEPLVFVDGAWVRSGLRTNQTQSTGYLSPGTGFRWASPVGTLRATIAHGYHVGRSAAELSHWQFYLSLGEEF